MSKRHETADTTAFTDKAVFNYGWMCDCGKRESAATSGYETLAQSQAAAEAHKRRR
ncbi:hypothetical protein [Longispora albida]|uniref:hypothetical protein n=1 Tax=Longispora albida TaxID=203523 RepID=UPI000363C228|nr:hypothetical protein [Longispora albida]